MGRERVNVEGGSAREAARGDTERISAHVARSGEDTPLSLSQRRSLPIGRVLGGGRFRVLRRIGEGGMGLVYEAYDSQRQERVALKTLSQRDPRSIYQFKNEFRALSRLHHPGLVRLHHLFVENDAWFFTMDRIDGERFDRWVRPDGQLDELRLREGLRQLVLALAAIHDAGKLHRDVKSSNVLVSTEGRVVVLDLGLVVENDKGGAGQTISEWVLAGTPEYMAPEQAFGFGATSASDFYAMGVMLFEALTGRLPFEGTISEILLAKQRDVDLSALLLRHEPPGDLAALCLSLLSRDAAQRPSAAHMLASACLTGAFREVELAPASPPRSRLQLLGRSAELAALWTAHEDAMGGQAVLCIVSGESGIGKTELCRAFLDQVRHTHAVVLGGRCYEREGVPFKAIDPLVDELSRHLRRVSREEAAALLPRDVFALVKLFPVLGRVEAVAAAPGRAVSDPYELQRRAFAAFGELLGRLRDRHPLIVHIDDVHWTDADSATFLRHLLIDRGLCPLLVVLSQRSERAANNPSLDRVLTAAHSNPALSVRSLPVHPLLVEDAEALAEQLLERGGLDAELCRSIAVESRGSPFFVSELARLARATEGAAERPSVSDVISARVAVLPEAARRLLQAVALVGQPLAARVALEATGALHSDLDALLDAHLMRETESAGQELVECYHDRIREAVASALSSETATAHYRELAAALSGDREADSELVSRCWEGAAEPAEAARHAVIAAGRASLTMAFDHAATLYRKALELGAPSGEQAVELMTRVGRALENGGRGAEAAAMYRRAAELCEGDARLELQRRAAEQWLATGHVDEGTALLRSVCRTLGVYFPVSPGSALLSLAWTGLRVRARDLGARVPADRALSPRDALRLQTAHTLVTGLIGYQPVHVASVVGRYLLTALDKGDLTERVRSLGFSAYVQSHLDPSSPRTLAFLRRMDELADPSGRADLVGFASLMKGTSAYHFDLCRDARRHFAGALPLLRGCTGVNWDIDAVHVYDQLSAVYCGDYADIARCTPALVDEALRRGRVWTGAMLSGFAGMPAWVDAEGPQGYRRQLELVGRHWKERSQPLWPDFVLLMGEALLHIREGAPERGFALLEQRQRGYARHMLTRGASRGRLSYAVHRARCAAAALGAAPEGQRSERARWTAELRRSLASVTQYSTLKARANARLLAALLAFERGARETSVELLRESVRDFERAGMHMFVAACRRRLGQIVGGEEGRALIALGEGFMREQHVGDVESETEVSCPGFARR